MVKAEKANPNLKAVGGRLKPRGMAKAVGAWPRSWRCCQGRGCVAKAVGSVTKDVGRSQGLGGATKAVRANPNPKTMDA